MKKILLPLAAALAFAGMAQAAPITTTPAPFNVTVNLASVCSLTSAPTTVVFNYTSLGGAVGSTGGAYSVTCTNGLAYTMARELARAGEDVEKAVQVDPNNVTAWTTRANYFYVINKPELAMKMRSTFSKSRPVMTRLRPLAMRPRVASLTGFLLLSASIMSK